MGSLTIAAGPAWLTRRAANGRMLTAAAEAEAKRKAEPEAATEPTAPPVTPTTGRAGPDVNAELDKQIAAQSTLADVARATSALLSVPTLGEGTHGAFIRLVWSAKAAGVPFDVVQAWAKRDPAAYYKDGHPKHGDAGFRKLWNDDRGAGVTAATLFYTARAAGWTDTRAPGPTGQPGEPGQPFAVVPVADLDTAEVPPQVWLWDGYIPAEEVTLLGAHGGTGKSTLALMLAVSVALGRPLFGVPTTAAPVVFFSAEDNAATVRRRLQKLLRGWGLPAASLDGRLQVLDATAAPELAAQRFGEAGKLCFGPTLAGNDLRDFVAGLTAGPLLIVDNASDAFGGNEVARVEVRAFVRLLAGMVRGNGGAVLLLAHVDKGTSRGERAGGEGYSGSTAWHNSARSRLYLSREKESGTLLLEHQKSNHGVMRAPLRLVWPHDGLPQVELMQSGITRTTGADVATRALLRLIHEFTQRGEFVSTAASGPACITVALKHAEGYPKRMQSGEVVEAMRNAERRGLVERVAYVSASRKPRERWHVTADGVQLVELAPVAPVALVPAIGAIGATGETAAPVAPVPGAGGVGGEERAQEPAQGAL